MNEAIVRRRIMSDTSPDGRGFLCECGVCGLVLKSMSGEGLCLVHPLKGEASSVNIRCVNRY